MQDTAQIARPEAEHSPEQPEIGKQPWDDDMATDELLPQDTFEPVSNSGFLSHSNPQYSCWATCLIYMTFAAL